MYKAGKHRWQICLIWFNLSSKLFVYFAAALITACFPCVTFGQVAEILDNGTTCKDAPLALSFIMLKQNLSCHNNAHN